MAKKKLGEVKTPTGSVYPYYWDNANNRVYVGNEFAGIATSESDAWRKANFYATTGEPMK